MVVLSLSPQKFALQRCCIKQEILGVINWMVLSCLLMAWWAEVLSLIYVYRFKHLIACRYGQAHKHTSTDRHAHTHTQTQNVSTLTRARDNVPKHRQQSDLKFYSLSLLERRLVRNPRGDVTHFYYSPFRLSLLGRDSEESTFYLI